MTIKDKFQSTLSEEELANLLFRFSIGFYNEITNYPCSFYECDVCNDNGCTKCISNWLKRDYTDELE